MQKKKTGQIQSMMIRSESPSFLLILRIILDFSPSLFHHSLNFQKSPTGPRCRVAFSHRSTFYFVEFLTMGLMGEGFDFFTQFLAPALGVITSELLALGPLASILDCRRVQHLGDLNPLPFPLLYGNSAGMIIYSVVIQNPFMFAGNIGALLLSVFYVFTVYDLAECSSIRRRLDILMCSSTSLWMIAGFIALILDDQRARVRTIGILGNIVVFFLFASPLTTCAQVFRTKNSSSINRPFAYCQVPRPSCAPSSNILESC